MILLFIFCYFCSFSAEIMDCFQPELESLFSDIAKPYKCPNCNYGAKSMDHLESHIFNRHQRPKDSFGNFQCHRCKRSYHHQPNLINHLRFDCGVEPKFSCNYCDHRCKRKGNLKKHVLTNHPDKPQLWILFFVCIFLTLP